MYVMRGSGGSQVDGLINLVKCVAAGRRDLTVVEIGSFAGESASILLSTGLVSRLYCVDPWSSGYDADDAASHEDMAAVERAFDTRHGGDARVVKVKGTVDDFIGSYVRTGVIHNGDIDLVYIDGCHRYDSVRHDILMAVQHIRPSLAISGHDYTHGDIDGVRRAVRDTLGSPDRVYADSSWVVGASRLNGLTRESSCGRSPTPDWSRFDHIFALGCTRYTDRMATLSAELHRVGISAFDTVLTSQNAVDSVVAKSLSFRWPGNTGSLSCTMGHYRILKQALDLGYGHIIVVEDDVRMLSDTALLSHVIASLPPDFDFAKFEWIPNQHSAQEYTEALLSLQPEGLYWVKPKAGLATSGTAMIAYSRRGVERILELMDRDISAGRLDAFDGYHSRKELCDGGLNMYLAVPVAAIQSDEYQNVFGTKDYFPGYAGCKTDYGSPVSSGRLPAANQSGVRCIIVANREDAEKSMAAVYALSSFLPVCSITYAVPDDVVAAVTDSDSYKNAVRVCTVPLSVVPESRYVNTDTIRAAYLRRHPDKQYRVGWYIQQFVKLSAALKYDGYTLVWDGDTIPCGPVDLFDTASGKPIFHTKTEHHRYYFECIAGMWSGMRKAISRSFIAEHMLLYGPYVREMFSSFGGIDGFVSSVMQHITHAVSGFSEYETYGTWVLNTHPDSYVIRRWFSLRHGYAEWFSTSTLTPHILSWLRDGGFDAITIELNNRTLDSRNPVDVSWFMDHETAARYWIIEALVRLDEGRRDDMTYWTFNGGRMANQLYYALQAYRKGCSNVYVTPSSQVFGQLKSLGLSALIADHTFRSTRKCRNGGGNMQEYGADFTAKDVDGLVNDYILKSRLYSDVLGQYGKHYDDAIALHVRNGDYLNEYNGLLFSSFDRADYVRNAVLAVRRRNGGHIPDIIHVYSDDIESTKTQLETVLSGLFRSVVYMQTMSPETDIIRLSLYRTKILFNSTFSVWAGFIGDVIFGHDTVVTVPSLFYTYGDSFSNGVCMANLVPDSWSVIPVTCTTPGLSGVRWTAYHFNSRT